MSARKPRAHLWLEDGGMVTGTDDPEVARPLLIAEWNDSAGPDLDDEEATLFPIERAEVQRGRVIPTGPDSWQRDEGYSWLWKRLRPDAKGPGVTTAVVWQVTR